jgi:hypothetical protein
VTRVLTAIPSSAAAIPTTAPVWALLHCHHPNAMPSAMKTKMSACATTGSFLTQVRIAVHPLLNHALQLGFGLAGSGRPGNVSVGTVYLHM